LGLLQFSNKETNTGTPVASPIADASPEPTIEPSPSASPAAAIDPSKIKLLVVNATTKAGYAGTIKTALEKAKFTGVAAGNAKGEYEDTTNYLLVSEELAGLEAIIEEATDLTFEVVSDADEKTVEDSKNTYDAVVVLSE
ncbi:LytR C-terminal domain-containing protein, partial [Candidatus Woesebacteria bacterium]|nr:LytR C-terminal domain-containing protein [Candidatus Woesebacteria bacterium]